MSDTDKLSLLKKELAKKADKGKDKSDVDLDAVQNIVSKLKKKDGAKSAGSGYAVVEGNLKELREIIAEGKLSKLNIDTETKLVDSSDSKLEKLLIKIYKPFQNVITGIVKLIIKNQIGRKIAYYIYSANIKRSLVQHLVLSVIFSIVISFIVSLGFFLFFTFVSPLFLITLPFIFFGMLVLLIIIFAYIVPMQKAKRIGVMIDTELPYALRHISTELQAGIGLYNVLQSIAKNDYGVLSDDMNRTVLEIENGTDTKTALRHAALRSQSQNYNIALFHIVRTLNTGGNLAQTINGVAESVSFDLMEEAKAFGEKMNFFGIIFIFVAIVLPVFAVILGAIANAPLGTDGALFLPGVMSPTTLSLLFLVAMPIVFIFIIYYIKIIEPKV